VLINTPHSPLKEAEIGLYGVGVDIASDVFVGGMVDGFVARGARWRAWANGGVGAAIIPGQGKALGQNLA